jgi:hypothetical protein
MEFQIKNPQISLNQIAEILKDEFPLLFYEFKLNSSGKHLIVKSQLEFGKKMEKL